MTHTLIQDCAATAIPAGDALTLTSGTEVFITQTLGGNVTVRTDRPPRGPVWRAISARRPCGRR